jgi:hypothetical protein
LKTADKKIGMFSRLSKNSPINAHAASKKIHVKSKYYKTLFLAGDCTCPHKIQIISHRERPAGPFTPSPLTSPENVIRGLPNFGNNAYQL